jgi:hypothetical protein
VVPLAVYATPNGGRKVRSMKTRIIQTKFWEDSFVSNLTVPQKLLFLFLITNQNVGLTGCYEMTPQRMSFDTGIPFDNIRSCLDTLQKGKKIIYENGYVLIINHSKYQDYSKGSEIQRDAYKRELSLLPSSLKDIITSPELVEDYLRTSCQLYINNKSKTINHKTETINKKKEKNCFEEFWKLYPRKIGKRKAQAVYEGILKKGDVTSKQILSGLKQQLPKFTESEARFVPHPTTWLNRGGWEDEVDTDISSRLNSYRAFN